MDYLFNVAGKNLVIGCHDEQEEKYNITHEKSAEFLSREVEFCFELLPSNHVLMGHYFRHTFDFSTLKEALSDTRCAYQEVKNGISFICDTKEKLKEIIKRNYWDEYLALAVVKKGQLLRPKSKRMLLIIHNEQHWYMNNLDSYFGLWYFFYLWPGFEFRSRHISPKLVIEKFCKAGFL